MSDQEIPDDIVELCALLLLATNVRPEWERSGALNSISVTGLVFETPDFILHLDAADGEFWWQVFPKEPIDESDK